MGKKESVDLVQKLQTLAENSQYELRQKELRQEDRYVRQRSRWITDRGEANQFSGSGTNLGVLV